MLKKIAVLSALLVTAFSPPALARFVGESFGYSPASSSSWLGGAVAGYNWQRGMIVFGAEGDIAGLDLQSTTYGGDTYFNFSDVATAKIDWYGTARARLGVASGPWLFYGTGGLAFGHVKVTNAYNLDGDSTLFGQNSVLKGGWVAGAGLDYMVNKNLVVGLQYQYVDLGTVDVFGGNGRINFPYTSVHAQFQVVSLSASWKFPPLPGTGNSNPVAGMSYKVKAPPPAVDPWAGAYAGAKVGGAQGDRLTVVPGDIPTPN